MAELVLPKHRAPVRFRYLAQNKKIARARLRARAGNYENYEVSFMDFSGCSTVGPLLLRSKHPALLAGVPGGASDGVVVAKLGFVCREFAPINPFFERIVDPYYVKVQVLRKVIAEYLRLHTFEHFADELL